LLNKKRQDSVFFGQKKTKPKGCNEHQNRDQFWSRSSHGYRDIRDNVCLGYVLNVWGTCLKW